VSDSRFETFEGWIEKATIQYQTAQKHLSTRTQYSESIQAAQECIELTVKAVLAILNIKFPPMHEWHPDKKEFAKIAQQIQERQLLHKLGEQYLDSIIRLPRLLFLMNFWAQFYITAKYGFEAEYLASAKDLFAKEEAELAIQHSAECLQAANQLRYLDKEKLTYLIST
jgi:HEPN domain-containing protein